MRAKHLIDAYVAKLQVSRHDPVIAKSGDRKTIADHTLSHAIRQWEQQTRQKLTPPLCQESCRL